LGKAQPFPRNCPHPGPAPRPFPQPSGRGPARSSFPPRPTSRNPSAHLPSRRRRHIAPSCALPQPPPRLHSRRACPTCPCPRPRMEKRSRRHVLACAPLLPRPSLSSYTHNQPWPAAIVRKREPTPPSPSFYRRRPSARVPFPDASASLRSGAGWPDSSPSSPAQRPAAPLAQPRRVPRALACARRHSRAAQRVQARSP
jgi:hypothetical protein